MANHNKQTVKESFNGNGRLDQHRKDFIDCICRLVRSNPDGFTYHDVHELLDIRYGRHGNYNSYLTVMVNDNLLLKDDNKVYTPSALFKYIVG